MSAWSLAFWFSPENWSWWFSPPPVHCCIAEHLLQWKNFFPEMHISDGFWGIIRAPFACLCPGASFPPWAVLVAAALSAIALLALVLLLFPQRDSCSVETSSVWNQLYLKQSQFEENSLFFHYGNVYLKATDSMIKTSDSEYSTQKSFLALWFGKQLKTKICNNPELANIEINTCRVHQKYVLQFSC